MIVASEQVLLTPPLRGAAGPQPLPGLARPRAPWPRRSNRSVSNGHSAILKSIRSTRSSGNGGPLRSRTMPEGHFQAENVRVAPRRGRFWPPRVVVSEVTPTASKVRSRTADVRAPAYPPHLPHNRGLGCPRTATSPAGGEVFYRTN